MFLELLSILLFIYLTNFTVVINSLLFILIFIKILFYLPKLSFLRIRIENRFILVDKLGFILLLLTIFSILIVYITNRSIPPFFTYLNKILFGRLVFVFLSSNLLIFYFFFEVTIIPTIMLILV